jgi:hypothetical protein
MPRLCPASDLGVSLSRLICLLSSLPYESEECEEHPQRDRRCQPLEVTLSVIFPKEKLLDIKPL